MIREIKKNDLNKLLKLYTLLNNNLFPKDIVKVSKLWENILETKNYHIIVAEKYNEIVSSCTLIIMPNLTHDQRSYALIENVITDERYRNQGLATMCLNYAKEIAQEENCYKIMLLTGSKKESTLHFYEQVGYNKNDKTAFIQWI